MADSIRERILESTVSALTATAAEKPASLVVGRSPQRPADQAGLKRMDVVLARPEGMLGENVDNSHNGNQVRRSLVMCIISRVVGTNRNTRPLEQLLDPLTTWATVTMLSEWGEVAQVEGLADQVEEIGTDWDYELGANLPIGEARQYFRVHYWTLKNDPTAQP